MKGFNVAAALGGMRTRTQMGILPEAVVSPAQGVFFATLSADQSSNNNAGDHIEFDTSDDPSFFPVVTLDESTVFTTTLGAASVGRFTITKTGVYALIACLRGDGTSTPDVDFHWRLVNTGTGTQIGGQGKAGGLAQGVAIGVAMLTQDDLIELYIDTESNLDDVLAANTWALIAKLS